MHRQARNGGRAVAGGIDGNSDGFRGAGRVGEIVRGGHGERVRRRGRADLRGGRRPTEHPGRRVETGAQAQRLARRVQADGVPVFVAGGDLEAQGLPGIGVLIGDGRDHGRIVDRARRGGHMDGDGSLAGQGGGTVGGFVGGREIDDDRGRRRRRAGGRRPVELAGRGVEARALRQVARGQGDGVAVRVRGVGRERKRGALHRIGRADDADDGGFIGRLGAGLAKIIQVVGVGGRTAEISEGGFIAVAGIAIQQGRRGCRSARAGAPVGHVVGIVGLSRRGAGDCAAKQDQRQGQPSWVGGAGGNWPVVMRAMFDWLHGALFIGGGGCWSGLGSRLGQSPNIN